MHSFMGRREYLSPHPPPATHLSLPSTLIASLLLPARPRVADETTWIQRRRGLDQPLR
jgi:hypothetical protein